MLVKYVNSVWSVIPHPQKIEDVRKVLQFKSHYYKQGKFKKERKVFTKYLISKKGVFLSGFIPLLEKNFQVEIENAPHTPVRELSLPEKTTLRDYQIDAVKTALRNFRGVIKAPTGSGKTIVAFSIMHNFPKARFLFCTHTTDLLQQTYTRAKEFFPNEEIGVIGNGLYEPKRITIATVQTLKNLPEIDPVHGVIVDEAHHVSSFSGMYSTTLQKIFAPIRIGFTATLPVDQEARLCLHGNIGSIISSVSENSLVGKTLAKPRIKIIRTPTDYDLRELRKYQDVYEHGVVNNEGKNKLVAETAVDLVQEGRTVLIIVNRIEHGENLVQLLNRHSPKIKVFFLWSDVDPTERERLRLKLDEGKIDIAITTTVWKEGVDIPSLGAIINASSGKSEIACLQTIGRGLRKAPGKDDVIIVDVFDDSHNYLIAHFGHRMSIYSEMGWL